MGFKRKLPTSLLDLIKGQPGKDVPGKPQSKLPPPPPQPQPAQTRSSSTQSQPSSPWSRLPPPSQSTLPPRPEPADPKRKRASKGKEPMDGGKSRSSREEDEALRASKQLKIEHQGQEKEAATQSEPQAWVPAPMLHEEPFMGNASLKDFRGGEGTYVVYSLERSLLLPTDMAELGNLRRQEVFLSIKRYLGMAVQATFRLEEDAKEQSRFLELKCDKHLDATRTLKNSKADLSKLKIAKEQITDLKKKLAEAEGAKNVAEWARDEALRAKAEAEFARTEVESSKEKVEEEAYDLGVVETQATLKAQVPGVENVYYPLAIRETAPANSEAKVAPEETETTQPEAALAITALDEPAKESELPRATKTNEGSNPKAPQKIAESTVNAQAFHVEEPALSVQPL
ncbi:uncharacterized protein LOC115964585 [Quercus lobata]|uniref:uncharacterized protein LOC115964585 n=1 Tax=Quercus lobata TaxID=97700 RepID=UPI0012453FCE|nr:uncharacterized protein LOC115964585 [Quercus lobata]